MKRHGDNNEDKQTDKRPCLYQVHFPYHTPLYTKHMLAHYNRIHQQATQVQKCLTALPSDLARLLLSFLPGRDIPNMLSVSHTARRLCACLHELDLSRSRELNGVRFLSSLVRLRTLDLSYCCRLNNVSPLSSLTYLTSLNLGRCGQLNDVSPLSALTSLTSLDLL
jgi:hypothetical protein